MSGWFLSTVLILVFVLVGGYFSATEMALVSLRDGQVRRLAEQGPKGRAIARLRSDPSRFLSVAQIGVTSAGFFAAGYGGATLAVDLAQVLRGSGVPDAVAPAAGLVSVTLAVSYVSLVFGELVPKRWAMARPAAVATFAAPVLDRVGRVLRPVIWLLMASADAVVGLLGMDPRARAGGVSEEELRELVGSQPDLTMEERRVLADVFTATDRLVAEVMIPRTEIDFLAGAMTTDEAVAFVVAHPHSRYPVSGGSPDDVLGVVHARDVLGAARRRRLGETAPATTAALAGTALALPDTLPLIEALSRMRRHGRLAVVVDEYGGTPVHGARDRRAPRGARAGRAGRRVVLSAPEGRAVGPCAAAERGPRVRAWPRPDPLLPRTEDEIRTAVIEEPAWVSSTHSTTHLSFSD